MMKTICFLLQFLRFMTVKITDDSGLVKEDIGNLRNSITHLVYEAEPAG